jgi:hypothetical protein
MTGDHPAWSLRAARGVVRDPLRFLAALGMTSRCAWNNTHAASSIVIGITPRLVSRASRLAPPASPLSPLIPMTDAHPALSSRAARGVVRDPLRFLAALGMTRRCARNDTHAASSIVIGITPRLAPRASRLSYQFPVTIRHGHPEQREGSRATRADSSLRSE